MVLRVEGVSKAYVPGKQVLKDISFEIPYGRLVGLLGPSGCGKTTLVKIMLDLEPKDSGKIFLEEHQLTLDVVRKHIGYVSQKDSFYDYMTVRENFAYFKSLYLSPGASPHIHPKDVGLPEDVVAKNLSGGQKKRLSILCALVKKPRFLFLDEPTVGLDPVTKREILRLIKRFVDQETSVVLVTHIMNEAQQLCSKVLLLSESRILAYDSPKSLIRKTRSSNLEEAFIKLVTKNAGKNRGQKKRMQNR